MKRLTKAALTLQAAHLLWVGMVLLALLAISTIWLPVDPLAGHIDGRVDAATRVQLRGGRP